MKREVFLLSGLFLFLYGLYLAFFQHSYYWYTPFVLGGTLFFSQINRHHSSLRFIAKKHPSVFFKLYILYFLITILIEIIGRLILGLWYYPFFSSAEIILHVFLIGYPFALFFVQELFFYIHYHFRNIPVTFMTTLIISSFLHEIPNIFAWEWVYTIPYVHYEIFEINIIVLLGWSLLVYTPLLAYHIFHLSPALFRRKI